MDHTRGSFLIDGQLSLSNAGGHPFYSKEIAMTGKLPALLCVLTLSATLGSITSAWADPPAHAPAHGWRKKHDPYYQGYTGKKWERDYGVRSGRCDTRAAGAVVGGALGGAIGAQVGQGTGREIAILLGTVTGAVLGAEAFGDLDRACVGHSLELARINQRVLWTNPENGMRYEVMPQRDFAQDGRRCREYSLRQSGGKAQRMAACAGADGRWESLGR